MGVPQGSILGPLLFVIYINDLPKISNVCQFFLYADDTAIFVRDKNADALQERLNTTLPKISEWLQSNFLSLNTSKTVYQNYSNHKTATHFVVQIDSVNIEHKETILYLGIYIDKNLKFSSHISKTVNIISRNIGMIGRAKHFVSSKNIIQLYNALVLPYINYCCFLWGTNYETHVHPILMLQKRAMRIIGGIFLPASSNPIFHKFNTLKVHDIAKVQMLLIMHKYFIHELPPAIQPLLEDRIETTHRTRYVDHFQRQFSTKRYRLFAIACQGPRLWNEIVARNFTRDQIPESKYIFKKFLKKHFVDAYI